MQRNRFADELIVAVPRDAEATTFVEAARKHGGDGKRVCRT